jgi:hypothetical protein
LPEVATGLVEALPVSVDPVEPVFPEVADGSPQRPTRVKQGATVIAGPELPESPELPELPDVAFPLALAGPVLPESALPEEAVVWFELVEVALPVLPPVVLPVAVESPLLPDVALEPDLSVAPPVLPEVALPLALPD